MRAILFLLILLILPSPLLAEFAVINDSVQMEEKNLTEEVKAHNVVFVLSIDGGGIRGIIPLHIIKAIEEKTHKSCDQLFQFFAGTSTGAIIAAALNVMNKAGASKYKATDLLNAYQTDGPKVFYSPWWYKIISLDGLIRPRFLPSYKTKFFKRLFNHYALSQLKNHVAITSFSLENRNPIFFESWLARKNPSDNFYLANILNGATSPLIIFPPVKIESINHTSQDHITDGVLFLNNPTLRAYLFTTALFPHKKIILISLGTGHHLPYLSKKTIKNKVKNWGILEGVSTLIQIAVGGASINTNEVIQALFKTHQTHLIAYYRFNILTNEINHHPFDTSKKNIEMLNAYGKLLVQKNQRTLARIEKLLSNQSLHIFPKEKLN